MVRVSQVSVHFYWINSNYLSCFASICLFFQVVNRVKRKDAAHSAYTIQFIKEIIFATLFNLRPPGNSRQRMCKYTEDSGYTNEFMECVIVEDAYTQYSQNIWAHVLFSHNLKKV